MGVTSQKLKPVGVEVLVVVGTPPERARAYLKFRPARVPLVADPRFETHRTYGLPKFAEAPELYEAIGSSTVNPFGDLPEPKPLQEIADALSRDDPYEWTDADQQAYSAEQIQTTGQFLVGSDGIIRWRYVEGEQEGLAGLASFPSDEELVAAASAGRGRLPLPSRREGQGPN